MTFYVNGAFDSSYNGTLTPLPGNGEVDIGTFGGGYDLNGSVGQVMCYNRVLTSSEVDQNFQVTRAIYGI